MEDISEFQEGMEFGRLFEKMRRGDNVVGLNGMPVRIANKIVIKEACKGFNYIPMFGKDDGEFVQFFAIRGVQTEN